MNLFKLELTHDHLVKAAYEWVIKGRWGVAFREFHTYACNGEHPDVIGFCSGPSVVVECKISRSDFFADSRKTFRRHPELGMGDYRYYCCPEGLIKTEELPQGWGLIYAFPDYKTRTHFKPLIENGYHKEHFKFEKNIRAEHGLMYSALRRLHIRGRIEEVYSDASAAIKQFNNK